MTATAFGEDTGRRRELLDAAYGRVLERGWDDLDPTPLAAAIGTTPTVLTTLFGDRDGLARALLARARTDQLRALDALPDEAGLVTVAQALWRELAAPEQRGDRTALAAGLHPLGGRPGRALGGLRRADGDRLGPPARRPPADTAGHHPRGGRRAGAAARGAARCPARPPRHRRPPPGRARRSGPTSTPSGDGAERSSTIGRAPRARAGPIRTVSNLPRVPPVSSRTAVESPVESPEPRGEAAPDDDPVRPRTIRTTTLGALAMRITEATGTAPEIVGDPAATVCGATLRAHEARPGDLFAALPGARAHGADFAAQALAGGAAAILTDAAGATRDVVGTVPLLVHPDPRAALGPASSLIHGDPTTHLALLGVTGTSGKTTTVYLLEAALAAAGATTGLIGTVETRMRGRHVPSAFTTPEAPDLQGLLATMVEQGVTHAAMEVSSHALAQGRVAGSAFAVGAFTNLSAEHLDFHPTMEDYFAAKARLFTDDGVRAARSVVCVDDEWGRRLAAQVPATTVSATGTAADWAATDVVARPDGTQTFRALGPGGLDLPVELRLPGGFNVANALVALACGHAAGLDPAALAAGLAAVSVPGRMQRVDVGQPFLAVVDYAHKPAAVEALLTTLRDESGRGERSDGESTGRVLAVLGCGGDRDREKRPVMGALAAQLADLVWITDDNPRTEDPASIRAAMLDGARGARGARATVTEEGDRRTAIRAAVSAARPGDVVVVAGKGHEPGQKVGTEILPFSDVDELTEALNQAALREDPV